MLVGISMILQRRLIANEATVRAGQVAYQTSPLQQLIDLSRRNFTANQRGWGEALQ